LRVPHTPLLRVGLFRIVPPPYRCHPERAGLGAPQRELRSRVKTKSRASETERGICFPHHFLHATTAEIANFDSRNN
jgi:hypothetical protein